MEDKKFIAQILKEGLQPVEVDSDIEINHLYESLKQKRRKKSRKKKEEFNQWYTDVQNALDKEADPTNPSQAGVIKKLDPNYNNLSSSEKSEKRSLFGKKLHKETNDEGGKYLFSHEELAEIRAILGIT